MASKHLIVGDQIYMSNSVDYHKELVPSNLQKTISYPNIGWGGWMQTRQ